ncbi:hypothetical protein [Aminipila sp.]|uniref:hypothetical protein n=1 Tax=Aminipila sp. TaxID=2060095 RepID=UPI0028A1FA5D|nr:hypothetical protein [Aminipila sp.]
MIDLILNYKEVNSIYDKTISEFLKGNKSSILAIKNRMMFFTNYNYKKAYSYNALSDLYIEFFKISLEEKEVEEYYLLYPDADNFDYECFQEGFDIRYNYYYKYMVNEEIIISKVLDKYIWNDYYDVELI